MSAIELVTKRIEELKIEIQKNTNSRYDIKNKRDFTYFGTKLRMNQSLLEINEKVLKAISD